MKEVYQENVHLHNACRSVSILQVIARQYMSKLGTSSLPHYKDFAGAIISMYTI